MFPKNKEFWRENSGGKLISMDDSTRRCIVGASATILSVLIERWKLRDKMRREECGQGLGYMGLNLTKQPIFGGCHVVYISHDFRHIM